MKKKIVKGLDPREKISTKGIFETDFLPRKKLPIALRLDFFIICGNISLKKLKTILYTIC